MSLAPILLMLGLASGLARGGRMANFGRVRFRYPALVFAGLALQITIEVAAGLVRPGPRPGSGIGSAIDTGGIVVLCASYVLLAAFVTVNRRLPGAIAIGAGLVLNLAVIAANGGMPVSVEAARLAGIEPVTYLQIAVKHREMLPETMLGFLGDVIPIPLLGAVVSIGDVVLSVGIFRLVDALVRYTPRHRASRTSRKPVPEPTPEELSP